MFLVNLHLHPGWVDLHHHWLLPWEVCSLPVSCLFTSGLTGSQLFVFFRFNRKSAVSLNFCQLFVYIFSGGMIDQFGSLSRASIQRGAFEELQRPAPPPYSSISRLNPTEEDEGTYLVWIFFPKNFREIIFTKRISSNWFHGKIFQIWRKPRRILCNIGLYLQNGFRK